jgi:hypothetical protein
MWIDLSDEEIQIITETLKHCNLHALNFNVRSKLVNFSLDNPKLLRKNAVKAAQTYFAADDLIIEDDYVKWTEEGDALVMCWQKVEKSYIETEPDCGCGK